MTREGERELVKVEHVNGGDGYIVREAMVTSEEVGEACKMYAKIHLDPAVMASPLITTIVDTTTLLIYFNVAKMLLHL